jgi:hypothetical protein
VEFLPGQRNYFQPSMRALISYLGEKQLKQRAVELGGYGPGARRSDPLRGLVNSAVLTRTAS